MAKRKKISTTGTSTIAHMSSTSTSPEMDPTDHLMKALGRLYGGRDWSDLTISCGAKDYLVHKSIVCPRSDFFAKACRGPFKEAQEGKISLPEDDPVAVHSMVFYLYHLKYDVSQSWKETSGEEVPKDGSELVEHAKVYALAEKYGIPCLKELARKNFKTAADEHWNSDKFFDAAHEAYTNTLETDRGLRDTVVDTLYKYKDLLKKDRAKDMARTVTMAAFDLLMRVHEDANPWSSNLRCMHCMNY
ncbi:hypothetical protein RB597_006116 [Gaeumannomyces tritici]